MYRFRVNFNICQGIPCLQCERHMPGLILKHKGNALISGAMAARDKTVDASLTSAILTCPAGAIEVEVYMVRGIATDLLIKHEGLRLRPYRCTAGKLTIGYGRNLDDKGISHAEALAMLDADITDALQSLAAEYEWFYGLDDIRKAVLIDMAVNLGFEGFSKFKKMIAALERGDYDQAAVDMLDSKWAGQVGARAGSLARMMRTGTL